MITFQAIINMAVVVNLLPVTGQPLPMISMGGSSLLFTCVALGIIQSVSRGIKNQQELAENIVTEQTTTTWNRKFIISGGGTGGHIFPALSIANEIRKRDPDAKILFVGALGRMEMEKVPAAGFRSLVCRWKEFSENLD